MDIKEPQQEALESYQTGNLEQAAHIYADILKAEPDDPDSLFMLGLISAQTGNFTKAAEFFQEVIRINPSHVGAYYNLGNVYRDSNQIQEAFKCYQKVLQLDPQYVEAYINLGIIFRFMGRSNEEMSCYQKALQINPHSAEAFFNIGHYFFQREEFDRALSCYEKVTHLSPGYPHAYINSGLVLLIKGRYEEAAARYQKAIDLNPDDAISHWHLSNILLLTGNYEDGWKEFEWFRKTGDYIKRQRKFNQPLWDGSDIKGRTILLYAEAGFGDTIQFIRYAPLIARRGAKVIVESQNELTSLLQNIDGIHHVFSCGAKMPDFDIQCPLMSLPIIFGTRLENIPAQTPYLSADRRLAEKWRHRLQDNISRLKVGLIWSGGGMPLKKSTSLDIFAPLKQLEGIAFYSLQKGPHAGHAKNPPEGIRLTDYTDELHDFSETAALIANLDLVISVDTAVAHLAGAMGKPVWTLLPFVPDWRWLLDRKDSPWYPTMKLFRQPALGEWKSVISIIVEQLKKLPMDKKRAIKIISNGY